MINFSSALPAELKETQWQENVPPQAPLTILDCERGPPYDMMLPLADACPNCGAVGRMRVGDWVCWGFCGACYDQLTAEEKRNLE